MKVEFAMSRDRRTELRLLTKLYAGKEITITADELFQVLEDMETMEIEAHFNQQMAYFVAKREAERMGEGK